MRMWHRAVARAKEWVEEEETDGPELTGEFD